MANVDERDAFLPFQSDRPFAASLAGNRLAIKGAPEMISSARADDGDQFARTVDEMTAEGLRVLAVAERALTLEQIATATADPSVLEELCRAN